MDRYEVIHRLGKGGCGMVYLVRNKENRKLFALKCVELDERKKTRTKEAVLKEARILSRLKHPHIVMYLESFFDEEIENLNIIQDYCDGGTLDDKIKQAAQDLNIIQDYCDGGTLDDKIKQAAQKKQYFKEEQIMEWGIQIIMAVQYMHTKKVLHRDLKAENVFLTKKNIIKIGDFGISKVLENTIDVAKTVVGTPSYLSPELCQDIPYSSKSDIWAVGCLLYEMCALKPPFDAQNLISLFFKIIKAEFEPIPSNYSTELSNLINSILVKSPDDRPSASAILNTHLVKTHLARFIAEKENLLQQRNIREDSLEPTNQNTHSASKSSPKCDISQDSPKVAMKRNKVKIASSPLMKRCNQKVEGKKPLSELRSPHKQDSGLGVSSDTDLLKDNRLEVPQQDVDASSDYSDDFDDSSHSEGEEDIQEVIEGEIEEEEIESDIEDQSEIERSADITDGAEYMDDFEEYDSSEDLDQMVNQAREAQDIEAVDDWFAESMSELQVQQTMALKQQCEMALGGRQLKEVERLVTEGTLTEHDLRPMVELRRSVGEDSAEICHLNLDDLDCG